MRKLFIAAAILTAASSANAGYVAEQFCSNGEAKHSIDTGSYFVSKSQKHPLFDSLETAKRLTPEEQAQRNDALLVGEIMNFASDDSVIVTGSESKVEKLSLIVSQISAYNGVVIVENDSCINIYTGGATFNLTRENWQSGFVRRDYFSQK